MLARLPEPCWLTPWLLLQLGQLRHLAWPALLAADASGEGELLTLEACSAGGA
jgi:hypothetical protein